MVRLRKGPRPAVSLALSIFAAAVALASMATLAVGQRAHGWVHWLCSPGVLGSAAHSVHAGGIPARALTAVEIHWPHFLPALLALATLVYLSRANARHRAHEAERRACAQTASVVGAASGQGALERAPHACS
jgi:hypothetical protein